MTRSASNCSPKPPSRRGFLSRRSRRARGGPRRKPFPPRRRAGPGHLPGGEINVRNALAAAAAARAMACRRRRRGRLVSGRGAVRPTGACRERSRSRDRGGLRPHSRGSGGDPRGRTPKPAPSRQGSCRVRLRRRPGSGKRPIMGSVATPSPTSPCSLPTTLATRTRSRSSARSGPVATDPHAYRRTGSTARDSDRP